MQVSPINEAGEDKIPLNGFCRLFSSFSCSLELSVVWMDYWFLLWYIRPRPHRLTPPPPPYSCQPQNGGKGLQLFWIYPSWWAPVRLGICCVCGMHPGNSSFPGWLTFLKSQKRLFSNTAQELLSVKGYEKCNSMYCASKQKANQSQQKCPSE